MKKLAVIATAAFTLAGSTAYAETVVVHHPRHHIVVVRHRHDVVVHRHVVVVHHHGPVKKVVVTH